MEKDNDIEEVEEGGKEDEEEEGLSRKRGIPRFNWAASDVTILEKVFKKLIKSETWPTRKAIKVFLLSGAAHEIWGTVDSDEHRQKYLFKIQNMYKAEKKKREKKETTKTEIRQIG